MTFHIIRAALCSWLHPGHVHWETVGVQCFVDKIELSPVDLLSFVFSSNCFWWNEKLEYKKPISKISILPSLPTAASLVYSLVLRGGDKCCPFHTEWFCGAGLPITGSVFGVGVSTDPASLSPWPCDAQEQVWGCFPFFCNWWIVHMGTDLMARATFVLSFLTDLSTDECLPSNYHRIYP